MSRLFPLGGASLDIRKIGVVGSGQMGGGIAQVCAAAGFQTITHDLFLTRDNPKVGIGAIRGRLQRQVQQGKLDQTTMEATLARLSDTTRLEDLAGCDLVVEAVIERLEDKAVVFRTLDQSCPAHTILATNTSSIAIAEIARETKRPDRVIGTHFFNPPPVMPIVEIVRGLETSDETLADARDFVAKIGKRSIFSKDRAGFIVNYLLIPYLLDAIRMYENGWATREDIDDGMKHGCGLPMGPLVLSDFIGLDTIYYVALVLLEEFREPRYAPPPLLKRMILAGQHGRKTGKGFYEY
ncbi:MAG TPA: 3-hydroxybutyryl-CoA dehydrogenase [Chloroflexota bacterium]|nr:3-hydroxybutyryl-CoA dehydrogenase [Chloroflexota bacterium]